MKILIVSQYFWPEYFRVNDLVEELSKKNHQIDILTGYPNYPRGEIFNDFNKNRFLFNEFKGCKIYRVPIIPRKKGTNLNIAINYISFLFSSIFYGLYLIRKKKYDFIFTYATSPILVALISILICKIKKAKHVIWVQDLWPNVLADLNIIKRKSFIYYLFDRLVNYIYRNSELILCQSLDYKKKINDYSTDYKKKIVYYPSWPEDLNAADKIDLKKKVFYQFDKNYYNILFAGNIGESQNFNFVLKVIQENSLQKIRWLIIGEGRNYSNLKKFKNDNNLENLQFLGLLNFGELQYYLNTADCLLISLKYNETFKSTIPGKFQTYLKYRKPLLGFIGGETSYLINKYNIGFATKKDNDLKEASEIVKQLASKKFKVDSINYDRLLKIFSKTRLIKKLEYYLSEIIKKQTVTFKLINKIEMINFKNNFIISGLNLAFLAYFYKKDIIVNKDFYLWPDGYFKKKFFNENIKKKPGRLLFEEFNIEKTIFNRIVILGNLDNKGTEYLKNKYKNLKLLHITLPFGEVDIFKSYIPILEATDFVIITLPTPKQEVLANYIRSTQKNYKIICLGGAINMLSGSEKPVSIFLGKFIFGEAIWRLQFDFKRRSKRLFITLFSYLIAETRGAYNKIKINERF
jgi:colanic acid biosynthesis glycosyl transferase WcaI